MKFKLKETNEIVTKCRAVQLLKWSHIGETLTFEKVEEQ